MPYEITYVVPQKPETLPEGATVTKLSGLPAIIDTGLDREIEVSQTWGSPMLRVRDTHEGEQINARLTSDVARRVRDALTEALGEDEASETAAEEFPLTIPSWFGTFTFAEGDQDEHDEQPYVSVTFVDSSGGSSHVNGRNINRDEAHRLGRALLTV